MYKELDQRIHNIGTPFQGLYSRKLIDRLKDEIVKNTSQLQKASDESASAVRNLPSVPSGPLYQNVTVAQSLRNTKPQGPFDPYPDVPMSRFGGRKARKSVRKSKRKTRKSVRKSPRKTKKSVRKSPRKTKKSARKPKKSVKKSVRKTKKSTRKPKKSVKKLIRRL